MKVPLSSSIFSVLCMCFVVNVVSRAVYLCGV